MASDLHPAIWRGPFAAELPDFSEIRPGEQHQVTSEDLKSDHWEPVKPKSAGKGSARKRKPKSSASSTPEPSGETEPATPDPSAGETSADDGSAD